MVMYDDVFIRSISTKFLVVCVLKTVAYLHLPKFNDLVFFFVDFGEIEFVPKGVRTLQQKNKRKQLAKYLTKLKSNLIFNLRIFLQLFFTPNYE